MGDLFTTPFDVLFKNFFSEHEFSSLNNRIGYPVDVFEDEKENLTIEIACAGLDREDIKVQVEKDILKVNYNKADKSEEGRKNLYRGIARGSFNLGWKIAPRFDLNKVEVSLEKGILKIFIPKAVEEVAGVREITIK